MKINKYGCRKREDVCLVHSCPLLGFDFCEDSEMIKDFKKETEQEMLKRVVEKVRELDKYDYIPVQVKEENPSAWAMYSEGRNKIFKDILASLEIINPKE